MARNENGVVLLKHLDTETLKVDETGKKVGVADKLVVKEFTLDTTTTPANPKLKLVFNDNSAKEVELQNLLNLDKFVESATLDGFTLKLTLQGGEEKTVDLAQLAQVTTEDSTTVTFTGKGTEADKLRAEVKVSTKEGNLLTQVDEADKQGLAVLLTGFKVRDAFDEEVTLTVTQVNPTE